MYNLKRKLLQCLNINPKCIITLRITIDFQPVKCTSSSKKCSILFMEDEQKIECCSIARSIAVRKRIGGTVIEKMFLLVYQFHL